MKKNEQQLDCALDLMRRLPPQQIEKNLSDLIDLRSVRSGPSARKRIVSDSPSFPLWCLNESSAKNDTADPSQ
ncbi:F-actin-capping subunit beta [Labeo rohita]|uniref:F-actin-capping subunit beta n=1 Tax=Labeo rohita TaxID=84645 RepID=A0A498MR96_LABRO|nr:F-actin-capping subunit beta [Labeo rohita]